MLKGAIKTNLKQVRFAAFFLQHFLRLTSLLFFMLDIRLQFTDFLLEVQPYILQKPYYGDLSAINALFEKCIKQSVHTFKEFVQWYNRLTANSLKIENGKVEWIDTCKLLIFRQRLLGKELGYIQYPPEPETTKKNPFQELLSILNEPLFSPAPRLLLGTGIQEVYYSDVEKLLKADTAQVRLARLRAQTLVQKPFFEVCTDNNHTRVLGNILFSVKYGIYTRNNLPDFRNVHTRIRNANISLAIKECVLKQIHFLPLYNQHTDTLLGDCSYLDTCHKMKTCRYLHYYTLVPNKHKEESVENDGLDLEYTIGECFSRREVTEAQWISCDVRFLPLNILGKFSVIINDPAWDIHMSLPYGTCKDSELQALDIPSLQDEGVLFLWVTGRSIDVGRKALVKWGYKISDEMVWVKLNQLKRTIVTGRTGHWLNHSKEHLLVGLKGNPIWLNTKVDCEVIVSGTRETLRKPDEVYDIVDRLVGVHARKLEIFGRDHNTRPGWFTIGNQLTGEKIVEPEVIRKYEEYKRSI